MANEVRLIDAIALRKLYSGWIPQLALPEDERDKKAIKICIAVLDEAPTIDPESLRPKGRWIMTAYTTTSKRRRVIENKKFACSECGYSNGRKRSNYCSNCGAKMEG